MSERKSTKRGQNEGSICQRKDGRWVARLTLTDGGRRAYYGKTAKEARDKLKAAMREVELGVDLRKSNRLTVDSFLANWLAMLKSTEAVKPRTWQGYESICRVRVSREVKAKHLNKLTPSDIQALYADLKGRGLSARSIHHTHRCLHTAFGHAVEQDMIARNPCDRVKLQTPERPELTVWSAGQAQAFLVSVQADAQASALYTLALTTGMRQGELLGLRWQDIDLTKGSLRVAQTLHKRKDIPEFDSPKSRRSRRVIVLSKLTINALRRWHDSQAFQRKAAGTAWTEAGLVFTTDIGAPLIPWQTTNRFKAASVAAGLPAIRFHDLRHTAATLHLAQGTAAKVVSDMLGHATISLTLDVYTHWVPSMHEAAATAIDAALAG